MSIRIIISDITLTGHPENVRTGVLDGYGAGLTAGECEIRNGGYSTDIAYAVSVGAVGVVRSIADLNSCTDTALTYYNSNSILTSFAFLSNTHAEQLVPDFIPVCVTVGAGVTENHTAYGKGLEFWDYDLDLIDPDLSSFANGRVFGKLLKIKDTKSCCWWEARYRARMTAGGGGVWTLENGYGKIDTTAAIAYTGAIPYDPYLSNTTNDKSRAGWRF